MNGSRSAMRVNEDEREKKPYNQMNTKLSLRIYMHLPLQVLRQRLSPQNTARVRMILHENKRIQPRISSTLNVGSGTTYL